jgi:hypothetical protein
MPVPRTADTLKEERSTTVSAGWHTVTDDSGLLRSFEGDMAAMYGGAKRAGYNATRFLVMIREHGGLETAHRLLASPDISYGFTELWMLGRQDLTVEALILEPQYRPLFSSGELRTASERLGVPIPVTDAEAAETQALRRDTEPTWTLERFTTAAAAREPATHAVVALFVAWLREHREAIRLGEGATGPLYFAPPGGNGQQVPAVCIYLDGTLELLFNELSTNAPFDRVADRIDLQRRLNSILGFHVRDEIVETGTWQRMDAAYLLSPGAFDEFAHVYEWVAERLSKGTEGQK